MNSRDKFLAALHGRNQGPPPVWLMRQAGRYLPEYRKLKESHSFRTMVSTPDLATEVTLQPLKRFPGLDAAILFSDILVIPEALGVPYQFRDEGGIELERTIRNAEDLQSLRPADAVSSLAYVPDALRLIRRELGETKALIGFCGAPWTLALYLVEGGSPGEGRHLREWIYRDPASAERLLRRITEACVLYVRMQCEAGADVIQIFDSWAGLCPGPLYAEWCLRWIEPILEAADRPVILFSRGAGSQVRLQQQTGAAALGIDWNTPLDWVRGELGPEMTLQGNFDPLLLETSPTIVQAEIRRFLDARGNDPAHILNAGHGLSPRTRIDCVEALMGALASR